MISYEENAETECERLCNEAMKYDNNNPEPYHTMASVRISQERNEEALEILKKGHDLWKNLGNVTPNSKIGVL